MSLEDGGPRGFATAVPLSRSDLISAPIRWPRPSRLAQPLQPDGRRMAAGLQALGLGTIGELLEHLPSDSREARSVSALRAGEQATVAVQVRSISARSVRRRGMRPLVEASVFDGTASMRATFFNQPWLVERYPTGTRLLLHGKADGRGGFRVSHHAPAPGEAGEDAAGPPASGSVAHYPAADGITSTQILTLVQGARGALADITEFLSAATRVSEGLPDRAAALAAMHLPRGGSDLEEGRRRLAYEELLLTQLLFLCRRAQRRALGGAVALAEPRELTARWLEGELPFALTGDQLRAVARIEEDLAQERPMQRLLMGEVGSGKTVVALFAMLRAVEHGRQAALMAPTETLAEQHFATIQRLLGGESVSAALLTGSSTARRRADTLAKLASGELSLLVGTHALIEPDVAFRSLAVAVIDEQHRFGVRQREALVERAGADLASVHTLHMTATPIPRTLALARYGDLETSTLHELPAGRQPIRTLLVAGEAERAQAYEELRRQLALGRQAFVVCPLIEEGDGEAQDTGAAQALAGADSRAGLRAAGAELERLRDGELSGHELALLHGAMRPREKQQAMDSFVTGRARVLVATTVIEVGIDVPNATVMLIENADRFGISQLHQLRGRVGRGEHAASCFLVGPPSAARLRALVEHADGFRLADIDLALRNEGDLIGTRQSGLGQFRVARMPEDAALLELARARAEAIVAADPLLAAPEHALLSAELTRRFGARAGEPIPG
ncbi:MAG: ATP-dependent DNA helicase RecG [Solirubrobacteraceae bacterium]